MARPILVKLTPGAVPRLLKSLAMQRRLAEVANERVVGTPDVRIDEPFVGRTRARQTVWSNSPEAADTLRRVFRR